MPDETADSAAAPSAQIPSGNVSLRLSNGHLIPADRLLLAAYSSVFLDMMEAVSTYKKELVEGGAMRVVEWKWWRDETASAS